MSSLNQNASAEKKPFDIRGFVSKYTIYLILLALIIIMSILQPKTFPTWNNAMNIVKQMTTIGIMALGVTFCIITAGTDLSGSTVIALCSVVSATVAHAAAQGAGDSKTMLVFAIIAPILTGGAIGFCNGILISVGHVPPFIGTLGMMSVAKGLALIISTGKPITGFTPAYDFLGRGELFGKLKMPTLLIIYLICFIIAYVLLHKTRYGTYVYAIGGNPNAAMVSGVNVRKITTIVYTFAGMFTGVAAVAITSRGSSGQPGLGQGFDMDAITCAIIGGASFNGGIGSIPGTLVGTFIMGVISNAMTMQKVAPELQYVVKGLVIIGAVLLDEVKNRKK